MENNGTLNLNGTNAFVAQASTSSINFEPYGEKILVKAVVNDNSVELWFRKQALYTYTVGQQFHSSASPDKVFKEVYGVKPDGTFGLIKTVNGVYKAPHYVEEEYEFDE